MSSSSHLGVAIQDGQLPKHRRPSSHRPASMRLPPSSSTRPALKVLSRPLRKTFMPSFLPPNARIFLVGILVSLSGLLYGLDTGSIGPITEMPQFREASSDLDSKPSLQGFFVASILLSASASSLCSGYVADHISRRFGIGTGACIFAVGATISAASPNIGSLFAARLLTGVGAGQTISVASIWLIEVAKPAQRGALACVIQFLITIGILIGYFICYGSQRLDSSLAWRLPFIFQAVVATCLAFSILLVVPFSPRWLLSNGREDEAKDVLRQLRLTKVSKNPSAAEILRREEEFEALELEYSEIKLAVQTSKADSRGRSASYGELFHKRYRLRVLLGMFLMSCQQLSGIDVILYFAPIIFKSIWSSQTASFLASGVSGIVLVVSTVPALIWVDKWGRKPPMVFGGVTMSSCFLIIGSMFAAYGRTLPTQGEHEQLQVVLTNDAARWTVVILIYVFVAAFSLTWAVVTRIYASEIVPTRLRSRAAAAQQLANWSTNFAVATVAPFFLRASPSGPYFLFAGAIVICTCVCAVFIKETRGKSLEEISGLFEAKT